MSNFTFSALLSPVSGSRWEAVSEGSGTMELEYHQAGFKLTRKKKNKAAQLPETANQKRANMNSWSLYPIS